MDISIPILLLQFTQQIEINSKEPYLLNLSKLNHIIILLTSLNFMAPGEIKMSFHSSRAVLTKKCSENRQQIYRRTPMPKCDFNEVAWQLY